MLGQKTLQIQKGGFFPTDIFGNYKSDKDRKEVMKKIKEELENPKRVEKSFLEKVKIIDEIYSVIDTETRRSYQEDELIEKIKDLMKYGIDINHRNDFGESFLMYAIKKQKTEVARYFIENKIDVNITHYEGKNALDYLVDYENSPSLTKLLVENKIEITKYPIRKIMSWNYINPNAIKMIEVLIDNGVDMNAEIENGENLLMRCCRELNGNRDKLAKMLIEKGCDLNLRESGWDRDTALHMIMYNYSQMYEQVEDVVNAMIEKNVDLNMLNNYGETPVAKAFWGYDASHNSREFELLKTLLNKCDLYKMSPKDNCILDYIYHHNGKKGYRAGTVVKERIEKILRDKSDELEKQIESNLKHCSPRRLRSIHYNAERRNDVLLMKKIEEKQTKFERMLNHLHLFEFGFRL